MNTLTGQYECTHRSGLGLDYFTAKLDRLTLYANGRFTLITQEKSRIMHAAKTVASGQQASMDAPETEAQGNYSSQAATLSLAFDDGEQEQAEILAEGLQLGKDFFAKVSDSTVLPPPQRIKSNMEDIAKGLKIAGTVGGTMLKAARTIQDHLQTQPAPAAGTTQNATPPAAPQAAPQPAPVHSTPFATQNQAAPSQASAPTNATLYCDQCGSPVRPGKKFCNTCGAQLV
jgi:hypothetical protein